MATILSPEDIGLIQSRNQDDEIKHLYDGGLGREKRKSWDWQKKFHLKFSNPIDSEDLGKAYAVGMLWKHDIKDGHYYWGICRNARVARWSQSQQLFYHRRKKLDDWRLETVPHPEDQKTEAWPNGRVTRFDVFLPWIEVAPLEFERVERLK